jgi:hypothetical protein
VVPEYKGRGMLVVMFLIISIVLASASALAHGELASGEDHDDPTWGELLLTPLVVGLVHLGAMLALLLMAYRARGTGSLPGESDDQVPEEARKLFEPYMKDEAELTYAFRPNKRMFIVSRNLPHFFILTGLAAFFSIYTYKWLGDNSVFIYTAIHASAIVLLFALSGVAWKRTWYCLSDRSLYTSFGSLGTTAISMPLEELDDIQVRQSRLKGLLDVSSLRLIFRSSKGGGKVDMTMRAIDSPDSIKEVIWNVTGKLRSLAA